MFLFYFYLFFFSNTDFEVKLIHRHTWRRLDGKQKQKGLTDFIAIDERLRKDVIGLHARVVRGMFPDSNHNAVQANVRKYMV